MLLSARSDTPLCLPLRAPPPVLSDTNSETGAGILSLLWKWDPAQSPKLTECPKTHAASCADTPLTTCDDRDVLLSVILTRSRSLYLPAHTPGHLSPKIVCTPLAQILSLPCRGLVLAWPGACKGWEGKKPLPQSVPVFLELGEPGRDGESLGSSMHGFNNAKVTVGISAQWQSERARTPALFVAQRHSFGISLAFGEAALWGGASISRWCGEGCWRHMDSFASCLQLPLWGRMEEFPDLVAIPAS